jgi:hypothetical protein
VIDDEGVDTGESFESKRNHFWADLFEILSVDILKYIAAREVRSQGKD